MIDAARYPMRAAGPDGNVHVWGWTAAGAEAPRALTACGLAAYAWQLLLDGEPTCAGCLEAVRGRP